jgi:hypothetical protein
MPIERAIERQIAKVERIAIWRLVKIFSRGSGRFISLERNCPEPRFSFISRKFKISSALFSCGDKNKGR